MALIHNANTAWPPKRARLMPAIHYLDPRQSWRAALDHCVVRFRDVRTCQNGSAYHNELAFHILKAVHWWHVDFDPGSALGITQATLQDLAAMHASGNMEDEALFDLLTTQHHLRANDADHILILGRETTLPLNILFGVDGSRQFRFGWLVAEEMPHWSPQQFRDFLSAWIAVRVMISQKGHHLFDRDEWLSTRREHAQAMLWNRYADHADDTRLTTRYRAATALAASCRSTFGMVEFERIVQELAFDIARRAGDTSQSLRQFIQASGQLQDSLRVRMLIKQQARQHVRTTITPTAREAYEIMLDTLAAQ